MQIKNYSNILSVPPPPPPPPSQSCGSGIIVAFLFVLTVATICFGFLICKAEEIHKKTQLKKLSNADKNFNLSVDYYPQIK